MPSSIPTIPTAVRRKMHALRVADLKGHYRAAMYGDALPPLHFGAYSFHEPKVVEAAAAIGAWMWPTHMISDALTHHLAIELEGLLLDVQDDLLRIEEACPTPLGWRGPVRR